MGTFDYFYGVDLGGMLLKHSNNLSRAIQTSHMSVAECQLVAALITTTLTKLLTEEAFSLFWERCKKVATELKITKPVLPCKRQCTIRYLLGEAPSEFHDNIKHYYRQIYFELIDTVVNCIKSGFEQKDYVKCYAKVESTLLLATKDEPFYEHVSAICSFYGDDLDQHYLHMQLTLFGTLFDDLNKDSIDIKFVINRLRELTKTQKNLFSEIIVLVKLLLLASATNAISERSCSTLRRIKTYLISTVTKSQLNHCMMLNRYKEALRELNLVEIANEFCRENEARLNIFGKFSQKDIPQHLMKMSVATQTL